MEALVARDEIRQLVYRYSVAIAERDVELMVSLYTPDASFGPYGDGPEALRRLMDDTMADLRFGVILVSNHLIDFDDPAHGRGEVWARCFAQNSQGYYEQLIKYVDRYRVIEQDDAPALWKFEHRRHLLWFGEAKPSPLAQAPANWPERQIGVGRLALQDESVRQWREQEGIG